MPNAARADSHTGGRFGDHSQRQMADKPVLPKRRNSPVTNIQTTASLEAGACDEKNPTERNTIPSFDLWSITCS
jgi:hypothetical protein